MFKLHVWIGLRYTRMQKHARRRNQFISFISLVSILGITLGVMTLIVTLSVMNGFEKELRARILGVSAHATVTTRSGVIDDWPAVARALQAQPDVRAVAPFIRAAGMLTHNGRVNGVIVNGIVPDLEARVSMVGEHLSGARLADLLAGSRRMVLGQALADKLAVRVGDRLTVVVPRPGATAGEIIPDLQRFKVIGTFKVGMYEYDSTLALVSLADAEGLYGTGHGVSGLRMTLADVDHAPQIARHLMAVLPNDFAVIDWTQFYVNFFRALKSQKAMMFVIVTLIVAVAAFNIVATLVMIVTDKESDIAVLRTLGASSHTIMGIFVVQGLVVGVTGTLLGGLAGVGLAHGITGLAGFLEHRFGMKLLPPDVYFLSELPSDIHCGDVLAVCGTAFALCALATVYPARRAARLPPADALRYE